MSPARLLLHRSFTENELFSDAKNPGGERGCQIDMQTEKERQKERNVGVERTEKQKFTQAVWFLRDVLLAAVVVATPLTEAVS